MTVPDPPFGLAVRPRPGQPAGPTQTTKEQVQAYRYGMRRLEHAVATGQPFRRSLGGPRHGLSLLIGFVLAALGLAGFAVYAFISPAPSIGDAKVVVDGDNGGAYVVRDGRLYPALNLASALLAAGGSGSNGSAGKPKVEVVDGDTLTDLPKGQTLGISGAPTTVPAQDALVANTWTVCDVSTVDPAQPPTKAPTVSTTVILGRPVAATPTGGTAVALPAALVQVNGSGTEYLLWGGRRSIIAPDDRAVALALGTAGVTPRPVSSGLLGAIPAGPDLAAPQIDGYGQPFDAIPDLTVGTVFQAQFAGGTASYVALRDGAEQISPVVADLIRADHQSTGTIPRVALSDLKRAPVSTAIDLSRYPTVRPAITSPTAAPVLCLTWNGGTGAGSYGFYATTAVPPPGADAATPAPPKSPAGTANRVYLAPGHGAVLGQVVGDQSAASGALFLVTDQGVKYPVVSTTALTYLGLGDTTKIRAAPPALLSLLPTGPTLDPANATSYVGPGN